MFALPAPGSPAGELAAEALRAADWSDTTILTPAAVAQMAAAAADSKGRDSLVTEPASQEQLRQKPLKYGPPGP